ncbi:hypothetical protein ANCDUO_24639, partial [Ancylostoma duodenale]
TVMGVFDVLCLFMCADLPGIWQITGQTYCVSPALTYITGLWGGTSLTCVILAFNRTFDLLFPHRTYIFDGLPGLIYLCMNNTIRSRVFNLLGIRRAHTKKAVTTVTNIKKM